MNIQFISREATDRLANQAGKNIDAYYKGQTDKLINQSECRLSRIEVPIAPSLLDENDKPKTDADCTKLIYQWLSGLSPVQAADERLWVYLTHCAFAEYMHKRWEAGLSRSENPESVIIDRWFFKGEGARTKMHNGISRLWWFGHVTYDSNRPNPFELTDILLSLQDIQTAFLERSIGLCRPLIRIILETIQKFNDQFENVSKRGDIIQEWAKDIRLRGGAFLLDAVPQDRLRFVVENSLRKRLTSP